MTSVVVNNSVSSVHVHPPFLIRLLLGLRHLVEVLCWGAVCRGLCRMVWQAWEEQQVAASILKQDMVVRAMGPRTRPSKWRISSLAGFNVEERLWRQKKRDHWDGEFCVLFAEVVMFQHQSRCGWCNGTWASVRQRLTGHYSGAPPHFTALCSGSSIL